MPPPPQPVAIARRHLPRQVNGSVGRQALSTGVLPLGRADADTEAMTSHPVLADRSVVRPVVRRSVVAGVPVLICQPAAGMPTSGHPDQLARPEPRPLPRIRRSPVPAGAHEHALRVGRIVAEVVARRRAPAHLTQILPEASVAHVLAWRMLGPAPRAIGAPRLVSQGGSVEGWLPVVVGDITVSAVVQLHRTASGWECREFRLLTPQGWRRRFDQLAGQLTDPDRGSS